MHVSSNTYSLTEFKVIDTFCRTIIENCPPTGAFFPMHWEEFEALKCMVQSPKQTVLIVLSIVFCKVAFKQ